MAFGILTITYIVLIAVSVIGLLLLFLVKDNKARKIICFVMSGWAVIVSLFTVLSLPTNFIFTRAFALGFGFVGLAGLLIRIISKNSKQSLFASLLTAVSVIGGVIIFLMI